VLARIKSHHILKPIPHLPDGSDLTKIYPQSYDRDKDRNGILVHVIRYKLNDPKRTGHDEEPVLMTTLLVKHQECLSLPHAGITTDHAQRPVRIFQRKMFAIAEAQFTQPAAGESFVLMGDTGQREITETICLAVAAVIAKRAMLPAYASQNSVRLAIRQNGSR